MSAYVLWGRHPAYCGGAALKLSSGSLGLTRERQRQRERDGGWLLAIYPVGTPPTGLRLTPMP